jgi:hypothetical protein
MGLRLSLGKAGEQSRMDSLSGKSFEWQAARGAAVCRFEAKVVSRREIEGQNRKGRIFAAKFIDIMEALIIPGVEIEGRGMPSATGENEKEFIQRLGTMDFQIEARRVHQALRDPGPGAILAEEENMKSRVVHTSFEQLLAQR